MDHIHINAHTRAQATKRKKGGSLMTAPLEEVLTEEHVKGKEFTNTEFLLTLVVVVPKNLEQGAFCFPCSLGRGGALVVYIRASCMAGALRSVCSFCLFVIQPSMQASSSCGIPFLTYSSITYPGKHHRVDLVVPHPRRGHCGLQQPGLVLRPAQGGGQRCVQGRGAGEGQGCVIAGRTCVCIRM